MLTVVCSIQMTNALNCFFFSNRGELRIIGAISIDLNGISDEDVPKALDEEEQTKVSVSIKNLHKCNVFVESSLWDFIH